MSQKMSQTMISGTKSDSNMSQIPRSKRLGIRNEKIMYQLATGITKDEICDEFRISRRQLDRIIKEINESSKDWIENLVTDYGIQLHMINIRKITKYIEDMESIVESTEDKKEKFSLLKIVIKHRMDFMNTIQDGPTISKIKKVIEELEDDS
jgi:hypothetical protein